MIDDLWAWVCKDDEIPVTVYKDDEETVAEVLNCRRAEYLSEDDSKNEQMCQLETLKISIVLHSINEMMNWMERQSDWDHLHFLHFQNIKMYVTKKCHQLLCQKKISDYFKNTD
jgi:hypothetical protein